MSRSQSRRRRLAALVALTLVSAGCLAGGPATEPTATPATETSSTPDSGSGTATATATETGGFEPSGPRNVTIQLSNRGDQWVSVRLRVVAEATQQTVHDETYDVAPNGKPWTVYDVGAVEAVQNETVRIVVTARGTSEELRVDTSECWGAVHGQVGPADDVRLFTDHC